MSRTPTYEVSVSAPPPTGYLVRWVGYYLGQVSDSGEFEITEAEKPNWPVCTQFDAWAGYYRHVEEVVPL